MAAAVEHPAERLDTAELLDLRHVDIGFEAYGAVGILPLVYTLPGIACRGKLKQLLRRTDTLRIESQHAQREQQT